MPYTNTPLIYRTATMLAAVRQMPSHRTFLRDRYFPTQDSTDIFPTEEVLIEYKDGSKKMAPCVMPRKKGITIVRDGYTTKRYTPPFVAPQRSLTIDDLNKKGFGENLYSEITPEQREAQVLGQDLEEFETMISAREEYMAAQALTNNGYDLRHYADKYGSSEFDDFEIRFYSGNNNPAEYTPSENWDDPGADIFSDLQAMIFMLTSRGLPATELVMSPDVAGTIINNPQFTKFLDIRNYNLGSIAPEILPAGAALLGRINVYGRTVDLLTYDETYEDDDGDTQPYVPAGTVILTAPSCGRGLYGAVSQIEESDGKFHTYTGRRVPKYLSDAGSDVRTIKLSSRPLLIPRNANPWVTAKVQ